MSGDVAEGWVVGAQVLDAGVLQSQDFLGGNLGLGQEPAMLDDGVLEFAQREQ